MNSEISKKLGLNSCSSNCVSDRQKRKLFYPIIKNSKNKNKNENESKSITQRSLKDLSLNEYKINSIFEDQDKNKTINNYKNTKSRNLSTNFIDNSKYRSLIFFAEDKDKIKLKSNPYLDDSNNESLRTLNNESILPKISKNFIDINRNRILNYKDKMRYNYKFNSKSKNFNDIFLKNLNKNVAFENRLKYKSKEDINKINLRSNSLFNENSYLKNTINTSSFRRKKLIKIKNSNNQCLKSIVSEEYENVKTLFKPKYKSKQKKYDNLLIPKLNCKEIFDLNDSKRIYQFLVNEQIKGINDYNKETNNNELKKIPKKSFHSYLYLSSKNPYEQLVNFGSKELLLDNEKFLKELFRNESNENIKFFK